jgi:hypothetical protein
MDNLPPIRVNRSNPHLLETGDGRGFFLLADTAWELMHRLTLEEADLYLATRARQGFNMVWTNLLAEYEGLTVPNRYGEVPFEDLNPLKPNDAYFATVDTVLDLALSHGLYVGLLPTWGDKLTAPWGAGPRLFGLENLDVVRAYGEWLRRRYAHRNIIWVVGGDRPPRLFGDPGQFPANAGIGAGFGLDIDWTPIWRALADGLGEGVLRTYHPQGGEMSTSPFLHNEPWLDMNAMQSGHGDGRDQPVWDWIERDYNLNPTKPTLDAEPNYEDHPVSPWPVWDPKTGYFDDYDVRRQCWRSVFSGACGVVYGHNSVWQFASDRQPWICHVKMNWNEAIERPGANQIGILRKLMQSTVMETLIPDQSLIVGDPGKGMRHKCALRCKEGERAFVYVPVAERVSVRTDWAKTAWVTTRWLDPRTGEIGDVSKHVKGDAIALTPPGELDWVLLMESVD